MSRLLWIMFVPAAAALVAAGRGGSDKPGEDGKHDGVTPMSRGPMIRVANGAATAYARADAQWDRARDPVGTLP